MRELAEQIAPVLEVSGLSFAYGDRRLAVRNLSFRVERGEFYGLLGRNGSGKSTALALMGGLLSAGRGSIMLEGQPLDGMRRGDVGVVFQQPSLDPKLTARENLILAARYHGLGGARAKAAADEQLDAAGLVDRARDLVKSLSGGMRRRLDIARALLHRPRLLLLDEPTSGLDELSFRLLWQRLEQVKTDGLSLVVATHRPDEAERCDRLGIMVDGALQSEDTPAALRGRLAHDAIVVTPRDSRQARDMIETIELQLGLKGIVVGQRDGLLFEAERGHEVIPRLVELFPDGQIASISLRQPSLADVFLKLTGQSLYDESPDPGVPAAKASGA